MPEGWVVLLVASAYLGVLFAIATSATGAPTRAAA